MILAGLIVVAAALRFWRLGDWGLEGDEVFTLRDSLRPRLDNPRPLIYFLNHLVVAPFRPLDEFGLRVLPALFGALAIPAVFLVARHLLGTRPALFSALLLTFSTVHVYQSQNARYWSLVFLLSAIYPYAIYVGITGRDRAALALGLVTAILAGLAHPTAALLFSGLGLWLALTYLRRDTVSGLWSQPAFRWGALAVVGLALLAAWRFLPMLQGWIGSHDGGQRVREHLLHLPSRTGIKQIAYVLSYVDGLTAPLVLTGALGILLLWQERQRSLALLLACLACVPVVLLTLLSLRTPVSTSYLLPAAPPLFIGAGVLLDRLAAVEWRLRPRWLGAAVVAVLVIHSGVPTLVSQYRDGRRHDFRRVAGWLHQYAGEKDVIYSDQAKVLAHYLRGHDIRPLVANTGTLAESVGALGRASGRPSLWIVKPYTAEGGHRTNAQLGSLKRWIYDNCRLQNAVGVARLDFRNNELQIYRCGSDPEAAATSE